MNLAIIDVEDTGFSDDPEVTIPQQAIEVAALIVTPDYHIVRAFYCRWAPTITVQPKAAEKNGYTPEAWAGCAEPTLADMVAFADIVAGCKWVGSRPSYDAERLEEVRARVGGPRWKLGTHRAIDVGPLGAPLCDALASDKGGLEAIVAGLARLGRPVPPLPDKLWTMARVVVYLRHSAFVTRLSLCLAALRLTPRKRVRLPVPRHEVEILHAVPQGVLRHAEGVGCRSDVALRVGQSPDEAHDVRRRRCLVGREREADHGQAPRSLRVGVDGGSVLRSRTCPAASRASCAPPWPFASEQGNPALGPILAHVAAKPAGTAAVPPLPSPSRSRASGLPASGSGTEFASISNRRCMGPVMRRTRSPSRITTKARPASSLRLVRWPKAAVAVLYCFPIAIVPSSATVTTVSPSSTRSATYSANVLIQSRPVAFMIATSDRYSMPRAADCQAMPGGKVQHFCSKYTTTMARGRTGSHTAMGDAWATLHALRELYEPSRMYWQAQAAQREIAA